VRIGQALQALPRQTRVTYLFRNIASLSLLLLMLVSIAEQADARPRFLPGAKHCPNEYAVWKSRESYRWSAFSLNRWNSTGQACGYTYRYSTKARAMAGALKKCNAEEQSTNSGRRGTCIVIGVK
jgi:hypothetical protein